MDEQDGIHEDNYQLICLYGWIYVTCLSWMIFLLCLLIRRCINRCRGRINDGMNLTSRHLIEYFGYPLIQIIVFFPGFLRRKNLLGSLMAIV